MTDLDDDLNIASAIDRLTAEIKAFREAWQAAPQQEINELMLRNLRAQMSGGIVPGTLIKPGNH